MDEQGRISIPLDVRKKMNLKPGEKMVFKIENEKIVIVKALTPKEFIEKAKEFRKHLSEVTDEPLPPIKKIFE
ncbi:MAG TPA: AbrB/MazE/SpoVT family DNA-binding domain-containing protein [Candidatus Lokiarchaeia archaeon]